VTDWQAVTLSSKKRAQMRIDLLSWYDAQGRTLPWRVRPEDAQKGVIADPYAVWLSEIMLQQTTVAHATPYWQKFLTRFPSVADLAAADRDEVLAMWAGLGYYARARNLHKCAGVVADDFGGEFPITEKELLKLPGIGARAKVIFANGLPKKNSKEKAPYKIWRCFCASGRAVGSFGAARGQGFTWRHDGISGNGLGRQTG